MAEGKKYGAFAGVFTPSLLTILGVIMYMRLGWVVGEAGILYTILIILIAHVISVTTGLSISSIATDKKIKTGGIYYILSRSLGLPMGGAIGIALFIGTALSISLYIVGFAESFLSIDAISNFLGLEANVNGFRIIGTVVIILLVVIAFISTSLAMKMQFFILITIALSLVSIGLGFFGDTEFHSNTLHKVATGDFPIEYIFAIFFPAVTGFTAGVAMSGDLEDPKKNIPSGTIWAIIVGFVVYVILAIGIAFFIKPEYLISDNNILVKIAWFSPLVVAGIWGATLSSALGGILGGPRILQAISKDKITPKIFGKGYGETNEPRNALLMIFVIAEGGILIGNLDIIAGVVSMFYLASYGFINLAYVLEKWASTDFRPSFKINIIFGIVGFVFAFAIMFKLDMLSMFASFAIIIGVYFMLKRRQLKTEYGDVWQSVWTTITRRALSKMNSKEIEERNWKPNILLFTGGTKRRPHLLEIGKAVVGKHGILSNFDLYENKDSNLLFTKYEQRVNSDDDIEGVFTRRQSCNNIYEGIKMIAKTYGFSGVEPNTVVMGWGRQSKNPVQFVNLINSISELDLNILLVDYDKEHGFGTKKTIDIWWRGSGNHGNLALTLSKFLLLSDDWENSKIRLLIVNYENDKTSVIRKKADSYLENLRIDAEVKIINNEIERKPFYDLMKIESKNSDLVFLGISEIEKGKEAEFVEKTNALMHKIGTVVLVKASSLFKEMNLGINKTIGSDNKEIPLAIIRNDKTIELNKAKNNVVSEETQRVYNKLINLFKKYNQPIFDKITKDNNYLIEAIKIDTLKSVENIENSIGTYNSEQYKKIIYQNHSNFLLKINKLINQHIDEEIALQSNIFNSGLKKYISEINIFFKFIPKHLIIRYSQKDLQASKTDSFSLKMFKYRKRLFFNGNGSKYKIKLNKIINKDLSLKRQLFIYQLLKDFGLVNMQFVIELEKLFANNNSLFHQISILQENNNLTTKKIQEIKTKIEQSFIELSDFNLKIEGSIVKLCTDFYTKEFNKIISFIDVVDCNSHLPEEENNYNRKIKQIDKKVLAVPNKWEFNQILLHNSTSVKLMLMVLTNRIKNMLDDFSLGMKSYINENILKIYEHYQHSLINNKDISDLELIDVNEVLYGFYNQDEKFTQTLTKIISKFPAKIDIFDNDDLNDFADTQYDVIKSSKISSLILLEYIVKQKISTDWESYLNKTKDNISKSLNTVNDIVRLLKFTVNQDGKADVKADVKEVIAQQQERIKQEIELIANISEDITDKAHSLISDFHNQLDYNSFIKTATDLKQYIRKDDRATKKRFLNQKIGKLNIYYKKLITELLYAKSNAERYKSLISDKTEYNSVNALLDFNSSVSPDSKVIEQLPFYYPQIFINTSSNYNEFWFGRKNEVKQAEISIERYFAGYKGAIAVLGEPGAGKSFFVNYICRNFNKDLVHTIKPPETGSINKIDFFASIQNATSSKGKPESILKEMPKGSVVIIDDLELWWEKTIGGNKLIEYIFELINKFNKKILFIVVSNEFVANTIYNLNDVSELFINFIKLQPQNAEVIKDIVLTRHKAGGLELNYKNKSLNSLSEITIANLFLKHAKFSNGNINSALKLWLASIVDFNDNTIQVTMPNINTLLIDDIDIDNLVILNQFVLHKHLTIAKISRILREDKEAVKSKLEFMLRSGIIAKQNNYYLINPFMSVYLIQLLKNRNII